MKTDIQRARKLVLASASDTRKQLLAQAGLTFEAIPARVDERDIESRLVDNGASIDKIALELAAAKAISISKKHPDDWIIGSDQTLSFGGKSLHKPATLEQAHRQLLVLQGNTHKLHCAAVLVREGNVVWQHTSNITLKMRAASPVEIDYLLQLEGAKILNSIGAYRLEGPMVRLFSEIQGDYFSILGLPLLQLMSGLHQHAPQFLEPSP